MKKIIKLTERDLSRIVRRVIKEDKNDRREIHSILDDIFATFEFSEKGNDEMITLAKLIVEKPNEVASAIMAKLKRGFGAHKEGDTFGTYTTKRDELRALEDRLRPKI